MSLPRIIAAIMAASAVIVVAALALLLLGPSLESGDGAVAGNAGDSKALIERGEYLAIAGNCASCHTAPGGEFMAGGLAFDTPFGTVYSTNITPDTQTGIGGWTDWDFLNSLRHGVRANGEHLYPVFPYNAFSKMSNEDVAALYAYFNSIPAVDRSNANNDMAFPFNVRLLMGFWKRLFFEPGAY
ncbi:MAG: cytochrome c, partial [Congregibacter sp.]|nr:cytochrome c [Congregibacter sp.]